MWSKTIGVSGRKPSFSGNCTPYEDFPSAWVMEISPFFPSSRFTMWFESLREGFLSSIDSIPSFDFAVSSVSTTSVECCIFPFVQISFCSLSGEAKSRAMIVSATFKISMTQLLLGEQSKENSLTKISSHKSLAVSSASMVVSTFGDIFIVWGTSISELPASAACGTSWVAAVCWTLLHSLSEAQSSIPPSGAAVSRSVFVKDFFKLWLSFNSFVTAAFGTIWIVSFCPKSINSLWTSICSVSTSSFWHGSISLSADGFATTDAFSLLNSPTESPRWLVSFSSHADELSSVSPERWFCCSESSSTSYLPSRRLDEAVSLESSV